MTKKIPEKRSLTRLFCKDFFCDCSIIIKEVEYPAKPINFHHKGILLFTGSPIPDASHSTLRFSYKDTANSIEIKGLLARFAHVNEMDIGCQYGLAFETSGEQHSEIIEKLIQIEKALQAHNNNCDRYGLFS